MAVALDSTELRMLPYTRETREPKIDLVAVIDRVLAKEEQERSRNKERNYAA